MTCSFLWYLLPGYLFQTLQSTAWICYAFPHSFTAQQIGSGMRGLGIRALTLDWSTVAPYLYSPLLAPFFAIVNVFVGYALIMYVVIPISYWGLGVSIFDSVRFWTEKNNQTGSFFFFEKKTETEPKPSQTDRFRSGLVFYFKKPRQPIHKVTNELKPKNQPHWFHSKPKISCKINMVFPIFFKYPNAKNQNSIF